MSQLQEIFKLVNQLLQFAQIIWTDSLIKTEQIQYRVDYCDQRTNEIVHDLYGLTKEEIALIAIG